VVAAYCAHQLQRPVRWIADRSEDFLTSAHGRDIESQAALALDAQGKILALRVHSKANVGAYPSMTGLAIQLLIGPWVQSSVYDIQTIDFHFTGVMTHTACTGAYRGAGRPEAIYNMERLIRKFKTAATIVPQPILRSAPEKTPYGVIYFGSTTPAMDEAFDVLNAESLWLDGLRLRAFPFPDSVADFIHAHRQVFVVEQNRDAQMHTLLATELELDGTALVKILHYDGTPITARFIADAIRMHLNKVKQNRPQAHQEMTA